MEKLSEDTESASIRGVSSQAGESLEGISRVQGVRRCQALSEKNKINADRKKYHHKLGPGGYETAIPKWDKKEQDLIDKGIVPEPLRDEWELRARNWFLAHGGSYDETTGDLICNDELRIPRENWKRIVKEIKEGQRKFTADRAGFAKVGVDEIMMGFNDMELDIAGPEDERTLGEVLGGVILWDKNYIKLPGSAPRTTPPSSRRRSPTPPLPPSPPHDVGQHNTSPSRSPPPDLGRPSPPSPAHDTKRKRASKNAPSKISKRRSSPKRKLSPLPKVPHANLPIRPYDRTPKENARIAKEQHDAQMKRKEPEPRPEYTEKHIAWAKDFITTPSQYDLHYKADDYTRTLQKEVKKSSSRASASGSKSSSTTSKKKSDVPQLGQQAKQSIPPLKVLTENVPPPVQGQAFDREKELADECGISVEDLLASQDHRIPKAVVAPKPQFVMGEPLNEDSGV
ncbi:hypothetical protein ZWY2020_001952 [Hordeum vulgare]|nr:hypothetical protein ZWY2020_001952 [Hordeum vulgare]